MKIVKKEKTSIKFKDLEGGEVFAFPDNPEIILVRTSGANGFVNLETGSYLSCVQPNRTVISFPRAELHLNNEV